MNTSGVREHLMPLVSGTWNASGFGNIECLGFRERIPSVSGAV
ncbi:MAG: hypothetical protein ACRCUY_13640 [Thermoguttaceae bacterium]